VIPHIEWSHKYLATFVGILGTTMSPYLFFWQAAQEVEEDRAAGRRTIQQRRGLTDAELRRARRDVLTSMLFSNVVMYFIILTTAATLHAHGETDIATARQAAEALRPLAGDWAYWLSTLGLIGTGMLGVPVLAGSCAYAVAEAEGWRGSLEDTPRLARRFYAVVAVSMLGRAHPELRRPQRRRHAVLVGRGQRSARGAAHRAGRAPHQRPDRDGEAGQPATPSVARLGDGCHHDGGDGWDVCDAVTLALTR
jgi:hypothetical protein